MANKAQYRVAIEFTPNAKLLDETLEALIKKPTSGSGTNLTTGKRDLDWFYGTKTAALKAYTKLTSSRTGKRLVTLWRIPPGGGSGETLMAISGHGARLEIKRLKGWNCPMELEK